MEPRTPKPMNPNLKQGLGYMVIAIVFFVTGWFFFPYIANAFQYLFFGLSGLLFFGSFSPISDFIRDRRYKNRNNGKGINQ